MMWNQVDRMENDIATLIREMLDIKIRLVRLEGKNVTNEIVYTSTTETEGEE